MHRCLTKNPSKKSKHRLTCCAEAPESFWTDVKEMFWTIEGRQGPELDADIS